MAFGLGGSTQPKQKCASDIFSFSGDMFNPVFEIGELVDRYKEVLRKISISSPSNYSPVLQLVSEYAGYKPIDYKDKNSESTADPLSTTHQASTYYTLIYLTPGVLDDYPKTLSLMQDLKSLPLSITAIKVFNEQLAGADDLMLMQMRLEEMFTDWDRDYFSVIHFEDFQHRMPKFRDEVVRKIPLHVQSYLEANNVFAYDLDKDDYATQKSIEIKLRETIKDKDIETQIAIANSQTLVNIEKVFSRSKTQVYNDSTQSYDEAKLDLESSVDTHDDQSQNSDSFIADREKTEFANWFPTKLKLPYTKVHRHKYIRKVYKEHLNLSNRDYIKSNLRITSKQMPIDKIDEGSDEEPIRKSTPDPYYNKVKHYLKRNKVFDLTAKLPLE